DLDAGVIVLSNFGSVDLGGVATQVIDAFLGPSLVPVRPLVSPSTQVVATAAATDAARRAPYVATPAEVQALAGRYYSPELDAAIDLVADGTKLAVRRRHNADLSLTATDRDAFSGVWPFATVRVERDAAGR